jgi:hypothetical protein
MSELGSYEAFVPEYVRAMESLYDAIYSINEDWTGSATFLGGITIGSLDSAQWRTLTSEYESMIQ